MLDDAIRKDFQDFRDVLFEGLLGAAVAVMVGVVLEGPEVIKELLEAFSRHRVPEKWKKPVVALSAIGWTLVALGVAGEFVLDGLVSKADNLLQAFDAIVLTETQKQSALANERAENATATAKNFESQIADSNARAKQAAAQVGSAMAASSNAVAEVALAEARIAEAQRDAARAQESAAKSELARVELEARITPRTLPVARREYFASVLTRFATSFFGRPVQLEWSQQDLEATIVGIELEDCLTRAGIQSKRPEIAFRIGGPINIGFAITGPRTDSAFLIALYELLHAEFPRESISREASSRFDGLAATLTIGAKTPIGLDGLPVPPSRIPVQLKPPDSKKAPRKR